MDNKQYPEAFAAEVGGAWADFDSSWGGPDDKSPERRAARLQFEVATVVTLWLREHRITQKDFAARIGMDRAKLNRLLQGGAWAHLIDLERLLGGCGETLTSISLAVGDGSHQPASVQRVISSYLRGQLAMVEEETVRSERAHPST